MALPPLLTGAVKLTLACTLPGVAIGLVGAPGTVLGVTLFDAADCALEPTALVATTLNVYAVPFVSPVMTCVVAVVPALPSRTGSPPPAAKVAM